jgi:hypothetical protein
MFFKIDHPQPLLNKEESLKPNSPSYFRRGQGWQGVSLKAYLNNHHFIGEDLRSRKPHQTCSAEK